MKKLLAHTESVLIFEDGSVINRGDGSPCAWDWSQEWEEILSLGKPWNTEKRSGGTLNLAGCIGSLTQADFAWFEVRGQVSGEDYEPVWFTGGEENCKRYISLRADAEGFAVINGKRYKLVLVEMSKQKANTARCNYWVAECDGETSYYRYPPSGGECDPPNLPPGFEINWQQSHQYYVIKEV